MVPKLEERRAIKAASLAFTEAHRVAREKHAPQIRAAADAVAIAQAELERARRQANEDPSVVEAEKRLADARAVLADDLAIHPDFDNYLECSLTGLPILVGDEVVGDLRGDGICILAAFVEKSEGVSVSTIAHVAEDEDDEGEGEGEEEGEAIPV